MNGKAMTECAPDAPTISNRANAVLSNIENAHELADTCLQRVKASTPTLVGPIKEQAKSITSPSLEEVVDRMLDRLCILQDKLRDLREVIG